MVWGTQSHTIMNVERLSSSRNTREQVKANYQIIVRPCARCGTDIRLRIGYYKKIMSLGWVVIHHSCRTESKDEVLASRMAIALRKIKIAKDAKDAKARKNKR